VNLDEGAIAVRARDYPLTRNVKGQIGPSPKEKFSTIGKTWYIISDEQERK